MSKLAYESPFHVTHDAEKASKMAMKVDLSIMLTSLIKEHGWTQEAAAEQLGVQQSRISDLANLKIEKFTMDALFDLLDKLGYQTRMSMSSLEEASITISRIQAA
jgi:predicted XRE-type DNA-binding protein